MICVGCQREIADRSNFCYFCGARQSASMPQAAAASAYTDSGARRVRRSATDKVFGGVCGGLGEYFDMDPVILRVIWGVSVFAGGVGILAYIVCWVVIDQAPEGASPLQAAPGMAGTQGGRRLRRSANAKWAGVCAGIAEYQGVDPTVVRLIWVVLSVLPGAIVGGLVAYLIAWMVMPPPDSAAQNSGQPVPFSS